MFMLMFALYTDDVDRSEKKSPIVHQVKNGLGTARTSGEHPRSTARDCCHAAVESSRHLISAMRKACACCACCRPKISPLEDKVWVVLVLEDGADGIGLNIEDNPFHQSFG